MTDKDYELSLRYVRTSIRRLNLVDRILQTELNRNLQELLETSEKDTSCLLQGYTAVTCAQKDLDLLSDLLEQVDLQSLSIGQKVKLLKKKEE